MTLWGTLSTTRRDTMSAINGVICTAKEWRELDREAAK